MSKGNDDNDLLRCWTGTRVLLLADPHAPHTGGGWVRMVLSPTQVFVLKGFLLYDSY